MTCANTNVDTDRLKEATFDKYVRQSVLLFLMEKAMNGKTSNYVEISDRFGLPNVGNSMGAVLSPILTSIFAWCAERNLPQLTSIVVRKSGGDKGLPSAGFWWLVGKTDISREEKEHLTKEYHRQVFEFYKSPVEN
jgi:hypothetical protein